MRSRILAASVLAAAGLMASLTAAASPAAAAASPAAAAAARPVVEAPPTEAGIVECTDGVVTLRTLSPDELARMGIATIGRAADPSDPDAVVRHGEVAADVDGSAVPAEAIAALPIPGPDMIELNPNHPCADPKE